ncbi:MAG: hypothetical protein ABIF18_00435 [archaeon]
MAEEKYKSDVANFQVAYALNPITSFDSYIDKIGNIFYIALETGRKEGIPILISPKGESVSDRSRADRDATFLNSGLLEHEGIAERIAKEKGYLFFPSGEMKDNIFSRSFAYKDFVEGSRRIIQNIDPSTTCNGKPYINFVKEQCNKLEQSSKYLDKASLKWDTGFGGSNLHIVGDLDARHIGEIESYPSNGFNGASLIIKIERDPRSGKIIDRIKLKAQFHPGFLDKSFSRDDFNDVDSAVRNVSEYDTEGSLDRINIAMKDNFLNFDYYMWDKNDSRRIFTAPEMMETFSKYVHLIHNGIRGVAETKKEKRKNRIFALEEMIKNPEVDK